MLTLNLINNPQLAAGLAVNAADGGGNGNGGGGNGGGGNDNGANGGGNLSGNSGAASGNTGTQTANQTVANQSGNTQATAFVVTITL